VTQGDGTLTINCVIDSASYGSNSLTKVGAGTLIINESGNTGFLSGDVIISGGTIKLGYPNALGTTDHGNHRRRWRKLGPQRPDQCR